MVSKEKGKKRAAREESDEEDRLVMKQKKNKRVYCEESDEDGSTGTTTDKSDEDVPAVVK